MASFPPHESLRAVAIGRRAALLVATACLLALGVAGPSGATASTVPSGFFGVGVNETTWDAKKPSDEFKQMRRDGVESVTAGAYWSSAQPYATAADIPAGKAGDYQLVDGVPTDFTLIDRTYLHAAARGMRVLPVVLGAPRWARIDPDVTFSPPKDPAAYGRFVKALVHRYGARGTFWSAHPKLPKVPTRDWQIWNEPTGFNGPDSPSVFWIAPKPYQAQYVALLRAAHTAIHAEDPTGRALIGGIFGVSWTTMEDLYAHGARGLFDGVAVHVYTAKVENLIISLLRVRKVMEKHGDAKMPLFLTEFSWPSAVGKVDRHHLGGFESTETGQAGLLKDAMRILAKDRFRLRLAQVFWYVWSSVDTGNYIFNYAGLRTVRPSGRVVPKPAELRYRDRALTLEGCRRHRPLPRCRI